MNQPDGVQEQVRRLLRRLRDAEAVQIEFPPQEERDLLVRPR